MPCSISGVALDNDVLCMCWYNYELVDEKNDYRLGEEFKDDKFIVIGNGRAAINIRKDYQGFYALKETFDCVENNLRRNAKKVFPLPSQIKARNVTQIRSVSQGKVHSLPQNYEPDKQ